MNDHDRNNLNFLLTVSPEVFDDWMDQADEDDITYAIELLATRKSELTVELLDETDDVEQLAEAQFVLSKFTLKA